MMESGKHAGAVALTCKGTPPLRPLRAHRQSPALCTAIVPGVCSGKDSDHGVLCSVESSPIFWRAPGSLAYPFAYPNACESDASFPKGPGSCCLRAPKWRQVHKDCSGPDCVPTADALGAFCTFTSTFLPGGPHGLFETPSSKSFEYTPCDMFAVHTGIVRFSKSTGRRGAGTDPAGGGRSPNTG